ncbi:hypothetical protein RKE30_41250 [Streptomyces sp. Li-HN-5-11]|uniref:hypothetical protein n=1 Tax=Streptomyces sp. Li-HN-5-11 TaxID=3075432 RepID=UPI0028AF2A39|nr:hypothetical protein [Streptomyces sp. Li-HN-5-11]WNM36313.1 hypothetical protein RKE30_41250 [Streptomyces sp. Li-HN-5-11]
MKEGGRAGRRRRGLGLVPRIVCEGDEPGVIHELIAAGLGLGLGPAFARRLAEQALMGGDRHRQRRPPPYPHPRPAASGHLPAAPG